MGPISKKVVRNLLTVFAAIFMVMFFHSMLMGAIDPVSGTLSLAFVFGDLEWEGGDNIGGFTSEGWLIVSHEVNTWPTQNRNGVTDAELVELTGNYVMKEGKKAYKIYITQRTGGGDSESQGEIDGKSFLQKCAFFIPGTHTQNLAAGRKLNNTRGIVIMKDPNNGNLIQFGDKDFPLHFKPRLAYGNQPTDRRGLFIDAEADNFNAGLIYKGTLPLTPAEAPAT